MKVTYEIIDNTIIASTKYHGKELKAKAKCHPDDKFDANIGMNIDKTRLKYKYLKAKYNYANSLYDLKVDDYNNSIIKLLKAEIFCSDVYEQLKKTEKELKNINKNN